MPRFVYLFISILLLSGCQLEFGLPDGLVVACSEDQPCSAGLICSQQHQVCVESEPICGNGKVEFPELCDDGFQDDCGSCNAGCNGAGTASVCGDGQVCAEFESCDDGYEDNCGTCNGNCSGPGEGATCGDGAVCPELESCDDGFKTQCGDCNADCTGVGEGAACGDGYRCIDLEECDDGNTVTEDCAYSNETCTLCTQVCEVSTVDGTYCGDGVVQEGFEICDPSAATKNCGDISSVFLSGTEADCKNDCSGWNTAMCTPDSDDETKMVAVAPGPFLRGCNATVDSQCYSDENPYRQLRLSAYHVDTHEVRVEWYRDCVDAGGCTGTGITVDPTSCNAAYDDRGNHPMNCVTWQQADDFCRWSGKQLPTEAQWEKAARGTEGLKYPWGNSPTANCARVVMIDGVDGCGQNRTWEVGSKPAGASPYGAQDMMGNLWEWIADWYDESYYAAAPESDPLGPDNSNDDLVYHVVRGGSWVSESDAVRASLRFFGVPAERASYLGFRCVY